MGVLEGDVERVSGRRSERVREEGLLSRREINSEIKGRRNLWRQLAKVEGRKTRGERDKESKEREEERKHR